MLFAHTYYPLNQINLGRAAIHEALRSPLLYLSCFVTKPLHSERD